MNIFTRVILGTIYIVLTSAIQAMTQESINMDEIFTRAMNSYDQEYIIAEKLLLNGGQPALIVLQKQLANPDPIACLMAKSILKRLQSKAPEQQKIDDYLFAIPKISANTPRGAPSPQGVANYLNKHFKDSTVDFLSLRLVKQKEWPYWKTMGILLYLKSNIRPSMHSALIRFAAETNNEEWQKMAIEILGAETDRESLKAKVAYERKRIESMKKKFPDALKILE